MCSSKTVMLVLVMFVVGLVAGCGSGGGNGSEATATPAPTTPTTATTPTPVPTPTPTPVPVPPTGAELYASNCATCHGAIGSSSIMNPTTLAKVKTAVSANVGGMSIFTATSDANLQLIVNAINATTPPPFNALTYFNTVCLGCHTNLGIKNNTQIQAAINLNFGNMGILSALTQSQILAIAAVSH